MHVRECGSTAALRIVAIRRDRELRRRTRLVLKCPVEVAGDVSTLGNPAAGAATAGLSHDKLGPVRVATFPSSPDWMRIIPNIDDRSVRHILPEHAPGHTQLELLSRGK